MTEDLDWIRETADLDWARELFDRTRGAGEPGWAADSALLARAGDRRRRLRRARAGGGLASALAVTAAVFVSLGAGTTDAGSSAGPGGAWGSRPLSDVFEYARFLGGAVPPGDKGAGYVPAPAMSDLAVVLGRLDPALTHLTAGSGNPPEPRIVATGDAHAKQAEAVTLTSVWTTSQTRSSGSLSFTFVPPGASSLSHMSLEPGGDQLAAPCSSAVAESAAVIPAPAPPQSSLRWSTCAVSHLGDGSTVGSASARIGTGTLAMALRRFPDGELFWVVAQDFNGSAEWPDTPPDPASVVSPAPWTEQSLAAALADPAVRSGWAR